MESSMVSTLQSERKGNVKLLGMLTFGHAVNDAFSAMLAPLIPLLMQTFSISATQAGLLTFFLRTPSVIQPVIGTYADRKDLRWAVILVPLVAAISFSLIGVSQNYVAVLLLLILAGIASAVIHAIAPVIVGNISNGQLGRFVGFFVTGGEVGRMLGPILFVQAITWWTIKGSVPWFVLAGVLGSVVLFFALRNIKIHTEAAVINNVPLKVVLKPLIKVLIPFLTITLVQYLAIAAMTTFLPTYFVDKGESLAFSTQMLAILQIGGLVGAYLGGWLSDKIGRKVTILITIIGTTISMLIFLLGDGWFHYPVLVLFGIFGLSEGPVLIAAIQELFVENKSLANGAFVGFTFAAQAIASFLVGLFIDQFSLQTAFIICALFPLIGAPLLFLVPSKPAISDAPIS